MTEKHETFDTVSRPGTLMRTIPPLSATTLTGSVVLYAVVPNLSKKQGRLLRQRIKPDGSDIKQRRRWRPKTKKELPRDTDMYAVSCTAKKNVPT